MKRLAPLAVLAAACALDAAAVWIVAGGGAAAIASAAALHFAAAGLCAEGLGLRVAPEGAAVRRTLYRTGWVIGAFFPLVGPPACVALAFASIAAGAGAPDESPEERRALAARAALEAKRAQQELGAGIDAIADALKDRDARVRVAAIDSLRGERSRKAVKFLEASKMNTVFDVRVRAVETLNHISKEYGDQLARARADWALAPSSPGTNARLAAICLEYARLGIEDRITLELFFQQAARHARAALDLGGPARELSLALIGALSWLGRLDEAEAECRALIAHDEKDVEAGLRLAELQFLHRNLGALPDTCRRLLRASSLLGHKLDPQVGDALRLWIDGSSLEAQR